MIKLLLQTTALSALFLSPVFCMDPPRIDQNPTKPSTPSSKRVIKGGLVRKLSAYSLLEEKKSAPKDALKTKIRRCDDKVKHYDDEAKYYQGKAKSCHGKADLWRAEKEKLKYLEFTEKLRRSSFEKVDDDMPSTEAVCAHERWKEYLKTAEVFFEEATALGYGKAQFDHAIVLEQLSKIDLDYLGSGVQERIVKLHSEAVRAGSDQAAAMHFIGLTKSAQPIQPILQESEETKKSEGSKKHKNKEGFNAEK